MYRPGAYYARRHHTILALGTTSAANNMRVIESVVAREAAQPLCASRGASSDQNFPRKRIKEPSDLQQLMRKEALALILMEFCP